eukprot:4705481-Amphidinium_carterae.1
MVLPIGVGWFLFSANALHPVCWVTSSWINLTKSWATGASPFSMMEANDTQQIGPLKPVTYRTTYSPTNNYY